MEAFITMVTSDSYVVGAVVLAHSLQSTCNVSQTRPIVCMITPEVCEESRKILCGAGLRLEEVEDIASPGLSQVAAWNQSGYTKLNLWRLTDYSKLVYVDADCLVIESMDELFQRETDFAAAPDVFPPDRFNAGVMVLRPSLEVLKISSVLSGRKGGGGSRVHYQREDDQALQLPAPPNLRDESIEVWGEDVEVFEDMMSKVSSTTSYDGGDTGFLNAYYSAWFASEADSIRVLTMRCLMPVWRSATFSFKTHIRAATAKRLPFRYNALRTMYHMTKANPGYWKAAAPIKCIHFCSFPKPWDAPPRGGLEQQWWVAFAKAQVLLAAKGCALALKKPQE